MPTLRFAPLLVLAAAAAVAFAQVKIAPAAKAGDQRKYKLEMTLNLGVADATVRSDIKQLVDAVDNGVVKETYSYENFVVELGGAPMDGIEAQPIDARVEPELHVPLDGGNDAGIREVEVWLMVEEAVPVVLAWLPGPRSSSMSRCR